MNTFHLTVASPDGNKFDGEVYKLDVRGVEGELAIMAGHIPFITSVGKLWLIAKKIYPIKGCKLIPFITLVRKFGVLH